ncbi:MAG: VWA domain-containing protein [Firmicutes bacterium]|nr:VWA domain-containing protein [Bacillota bacterium]
MEPTVGAAGQEPIGLELRLSRRYVVSGERALLYLLIRLRGRQGEPTTRPPLNLAMVLDRSGSMSGEKLLKAKKAVGFAIDHLSPQDRFSLVVYDDLVDVVVPSGAVVSKDFLRQRVAAIEPGGATNLSGGLLAGCAEVESGLDPARVNRVILLSDGLANVGISDASALAEVARQKVKRGLTISTIGVGDDFDEDLMVGLATAGQGNFYYVENADQIPAVFREELAGLLATVAQSLVLRLRPAEGVAVTGVLAYPCRQDGRATLIPLPDMYSGETKSVVVRLLVPALPEGEHALVETELEYVSVPDAVQHRIRTRVGVSSTGDPTLVPTHEDAETLKAVLMQEAAAAREEAIRRADEGDVGGAIETLTAASKRMESFPCLAGEPELREQADLLRSEAQTLEARGYDVRTRKTMTYAAYTARRSKPPRRPSQQPQDSAP